ncbi:MAG TPA: Ig-like domain-containing protein [Bacillales bacterium]|nr:Ig-like domain-containing protein [Bacillales bacterium]
MAKRMNKILKIVIVSLVTSMTLMPTYLARANTQEMSTLGDTPTAWPEVFTPYTQTDGTPIFDPGADVHPIDVDITSGVAKGYGNLPSMYIASDGTNLFVRFRLKGNPYDRKGGFLSSVWLMKLAVNGVTKATIGLDGKSPHFDYVYVANADGTKVQPIYITPTDGGNTVPGTRITEAENRQYFLDFQVPIQRIIDVAPEVTLSTPMQFFLGTSKAANLTVINKEWMDTNSSDGEKVSFNGLSEWILDQQPLTVVINGGGSKEYNATTGFTLSGMTSLESGTATVDIDGTTYMATIESNNWHLDLPESVSGVNGVYTATVTVSDLGETATATQEITIDTGSDGLITIDGGATATTNSVNPIITGTAGGSNGSKVQLFVHNQADATNQSDVEGSANANNGTWSTSVALPNPVDGQVYTLVAKYTNSNGTTTLATTSQELTYQSTAASVSFPTVGIDTVTGDAIPNIKGSSTGADQIEVQIDGVIVGIVTPAAGGSWSISLEKPFAEGSHEIKVIAKNSYGSATAKTTYTISSTAISIDNGTALVTNDNQPTIQGNTNAPDGTMITVKIGSETYQVKALNERWVLEYPLDQYLPDGTYPVTVTVGEASANQTLTVDTSTFVTITKPSDGSSTSETSPLLSGTSEKAATVELILTNTEGKAAFIKNVTAAQNLLDPNKGDWIAALADGLPVGTYTLTATASDRNANEAVETSSFTITSTKISIANVDPVTATVSNGTSEAEAKAALGITVEVTLENGTKLEVPITWSTEATPNYDGSTAGDYVYTGTFGTLPEGIDNAGNVAAPTGTVTVGAPAKVSIQSVSNVKKVVANGTSEAEAKAALGTTVEVTLENGSAISVPITWSTEATPNYDGTTAGDYVYTGTFGTLPEGIDNAENVAAPTGTVTVEAPQTVSIQSVSNVKKVVANGTSEVEAKAALGTTVEVTLQNGSVISVPITWSTDASPEYDGNTAGDYVYTGTFGTLPEGIDNAENVTAPTGAVTVGAPAKVSIQSVSNVKKVVANGTSEAEAKAALGATVEVTLENGSVISVPITWSTEASPEYDGSTAGDYVYTGTFGTLPEGIDNAGNVAAPTGLITVLKALSSEKQIVSTKFGEVDAANNVTGVPAGTQVSDFLEGLMVSKGTKIEMVNKNGVIVENPEITDVTGDMIIRIKAGDGSVSEHSISIVWPVVLQLTSDPKSIVGDGKSQATLKAVLHDLNGNPISHVEVQFVAEVGTLSKEMVETNHHGEAVATLTSPRMIGTEAITKHVRVIVVDPVRGISAKDEIAIHFQPPIIVGQVLDANGKPIANATVWIMVDGEKIKAVTNRNGKYRITVPRSGDYTVHIKVAMLVDGQEVISTFTQQAEVKSTGQSELYKPDRKVSGQLFVNTRNHQIKTTQEMFPDGKLSVHVLNDPNGLIQAKINQAGKYELTGFEPGKTYQVVFSIEKNGESLAGKLSEITVGTDGQIVVVNELIDPFGIVTDSRTGDPIPGVTMKIYWADTQLNRDKGHTPNTLVELPTLDHFPPNQNRNPQITTEVLKSHLGVGNYAWMLFANGDYYIISEKDGYTTYDSRQDLKTDTQVGDSWIRNGTIHIGHTMIRYDIAMNALHSQPSSTQTDEPKEATVKEIDTPQPQDEGTANTEIGKMENKELPNTATRLYDRLFIGLVMMGLGILLIALKGRKAEGEE